MNIEFREFKGEWDWGWVRLHANPLRVEDTCGLMAIDADTNSTVGAIILDNFTNTSCQCHFILIDQNALKQRFLETCAEYVFNLKGMLTAYGWVAGNNKKAILLNTNMGWETKAVFADGYSKGVDYLLMEMTRANCKYLTQEAA
jgi:hypothetical protein